MPYTVFQTFAHRCSHTPNHTNNHDVLNSHLDHITLEKLDRITSRIHRSYQRELIRQSGVDIQSQEAYELASRGLLHPVGPTNPLLTDITCTMFEPPDFELGIKWKGFLYSGTSL